MSKRSADTIIHMDVNSQEWKDKMAKLNEQLDNRDGNLRHEQFAIGYRKHLTKNPPK
jgi:hypothetical protein